MEIIQNLIVVKKYKSITTTSLFIIAAVTLFIQGISYQPPDINHAEVIRGLNSATLKKGKEIYNRACIACHGKDGSASLPQARSFNKDKLRFGNKPYDMWKTISYGAGMMAAQTWLNPSERYYVIQYIREEFMKNSNPRQYFKVTDEYLAKLPKSQKTIEQQMAETKREALKGSLKFGQEWFMYNKTDYGFAMYSQLKDHGTTALTVQLDGGALLSYNLLRMGTEAAWQGKLNVSDTKFKRYRGEGEPFIEGREIDGLGLWQWTYNDQLDALNASTGVRSPLPAEVLDYHGHYKNGKDVVLSYAVSGREVLEYPRAIRQNSKLILSQTLKIGPGKEQKIYIGQLADSNAAFKNGTMGAAGKITDSYSAGAGNILVSSTRSKGITNKFIAAGVVADGADPEWTIDEKNRLVLTIPASGSELTVNVLRVSGKGDSALRSFASFVKKESITKKFPSLSTMIKGGPAWWNKKVTVKGELDVSRPHFDPRYYEDEDKTNAKKLVNLPDDYPYAVDNISLPYNNAYNVWVRPTCVNFMADGRLLLGTYTGDVWLGTGIDSALNNITWQRIASGLYEPMGIKVIKDEIYVTCRNGIMILRDLNGDNEIDFYENFHSDHDVSRFFHSFNFGLETDSKGNIYYTKPGQYTDNKDPGDVIKVSPDGKSWESIATGFRVDNGITITPDDRIFVSDNQGNWTPANKINYIQKGKYYGYVPNIVEPGWSPNGMKINKDQLVNGVISPSIVPVPDTFQPPALWMPQEFDNSPGGGVWSNKDWGPFGDQFIHTSYGTGWMYYFRPHEVDGVMQGAMVSMPFQFDAGIQRATVNPVDKQVYATGLTGWDDGVSTKYGVLSRVRYKGGQGHLLKDAEVVKGGIKLTFNFRLDQAASAGSSYDVSQWNYKRTSRYGSDEFSLKNPGEKGQDSVPVSNAVIGEDGQSVILAMPGLGPVHTMRIRFDVKGADGVQLKDAVYLTINKVPE